MDSRLTLAVRQTFRELLEEARRSGSKVYLLIDDGGLIRAEGVIRDITTDETSQLIELENGTRIDIRKIAAVNGIFLPEYAEC